jgi:hypothetical protein
MYDEQRLLDNQTECAIAVEKVEKKLPGNTRDRRLQMISVQRITTKGSQEI